MKKYIHSKSQIAFEAVLLFSFLLVGLGVSTGVVGFFISGFNEDNLDNQRDEFAQSIIREFENAASSPNAFRRRFEIPPHELTKFELEFIENMSIFVIRDIRKYGSESVIDYIYEIPGAFIFNKTFFLEIESSGTWRVSFNEDIFEELDRLDLGPLNASITFLEIGCYHPSNVGSIGEGAPCENMLIVDNDLLREVASSSVGGDESFEILGPDGNTYTFGNSSFNIFTGQVTDMSNLLRIKKTPLIGVRKMMSI
ncbi:MAG: hypothetical protein ACMXYB_03160 [Candidatus Woesearchaeota archaeon]